MSLLSTPKDYRVGVLLSCHQDRRSEDRLDKQYGCWSYDRYLKCSRSANVVKLVIVCKINYLNCFVEQRSPLSSLFIAFLPPSYQTSFSRLVHSVLISGICLQSCMPYHDIALGKTPIPLPFLLPVFFSIFLSDMLIYVMFIENEL